MIFLNRFQSILAAVFLAVTASLSVAPVSAGWRALEKCRLEQADRYFWPDSEVGYSIHRGGFQLTWIANKFL